MCYCYALPEWLYESLMQADQFVLLETSRCDRENRYSYLFTGPLHTLEIAEPTEMPDLLRDIQSLVEQGYYVAGYFGYECGYGLTHPQRFNYAGHGQPLAWFGVYRQPTVFDHFSGELTTTPELEAAARGRRPSTALGTYHIDRLQFDLSEQEYAERVARVKEYLLSGDTYQINFTGRYRFAFEGSSLALYRALKQQQQVPYGALIRARGQDILCFSPELFFRIDGRRATARPMKGTTARGRTLAEDAQRATWLHSDVKNRAENLMIVDLLRNDLGRVSCIGSVQVPELFAVEKYNTLFQMTSSVEATLNEDVDYSTLFESLFPCGSITGAPKVRSMEIIQELETSPRGVYTGSIGYFAPAAGDASLHGSAAFNVAIRTVVLSGGRGEMGSGSGLVFDSVAADEYAECAVKAHFLTQDPVAFDILESILWDNGYQRLELHLQRMADSAEYFGYAFDRVEAERRLAQESAQCLSGSRYKLRLRLSRTGLLDCTALPLRNPPEPEPLLIALGDRSTDSRDTFLYHKTTHRPLYNRATRLAERRGYADIIFLNERGEVTEGAISTIFIERCGRLLTPPLQCGLLNGVYRQCVLAEQPRAQEQVLYVEDLLQAESIYICNAVRGWRRVLLAPERLAC